MSEIRVDTISEKTSANGVVIDGVTLKDNTLKADQGSYNAVLGGNSLTFSRDGDSNILANATSSASLNITSGNKIVSNALNYHAFLTGSSGGTERARLTSSGLGIGESSPDTRLHVTETMNVAYSADNFTLDANALLKLENPSTTGGAFSAIQFRTGSGADLFFGGVQGSGNAGDFVFARQDSTDLELMRIASDGKVGIGETAPLGKMHIKSADSGASVGGNGDELVLENSAECGLSILSGASNNGNIYFGDSGGSATGIINYNHANNYMAFSTNGGNERMRIDSAGNVGIGNTTMSSFSSAGTTRFVVGDGSGDEGMTIYSGNASSANIAFADGTSGDARHAGIISYLHGENSMRFFTNGTEKIKLLSDGKVGIGTSSPTTTLSVNGVITHIGGTASSTSDLTTGGLHFHDASTSAGNIMPITFTPSATANRARAGIGFISQAQDGSAGFAADIAFYTRGAADGSTLGTSDERMRISSTGKVGINLANTGTAMLKIGIPNAQYGLETLPEVNQTYYAAIFRNSSGNDVGRIESTASATSFVTSSDYRLKENVSYDFDATTRLKQLKPSRFNFINTPDTTVDGFLAHEVSGIVPEAISGEKDAVDSDGNAVYQGIDQSKLIPLLVKTIQELEARIRTLENN